jgi:hypothetical protein
MQLHASMPDPSSMQPPGGNPPPSESEYETVYVYETVTASEEEEQATPSTQPQVLSQQIEPRRGESTPEAVVAETSSSAAALEAPEAELKQVG